MGSSVGVKNGNFGNHKKLWDTKPNPMTGLFGKKSPRTKRVLQFDLNMNFIKEWDSLIDIERELNFHQSGISNCCSGKYKTSNGFI
jgi:hypothetical protein